METCELYRLIPKDKLNYLFSHSDASAELDASFLGFEDVYKDVLRYVPKDKTIIDLGCAYATQSWYFRDHRKYIGVDCSMNEDSVIHTENSEFYFMSIQEFLQDVFPSLNIDLKETFAVCSYVPDEEARMLAEETFPYCRVYYPEIVSVMKPPDVHKQTVYRFELSFAGEPQGVGILQGLDDTPIAPSNRDKLYHFFDSLPVPPLLDTPDGGPVSFWFTRKGLEEYADALNAIISELEEYDWQVIAKPVDLDSGERCCLSIRDALYVDKYQVGFSYSDVIEATFFQKCDYQEVNRIVPDCKNPIWFKNTKPSLDVMIQEADSRTGEGCSFSVSKDRYTSSELSF